MCSSDLWSNRESVRDPGAYLFAATRSAAMDLVRRNERLKQREAAAVPSTALFVSPIESVERREAIEAALARLQRDQCEVLVMKIWGGLTFAQIAAVLSIPPNTAASRYRYALEFMRDQLGEDQV